jgi:hypothetical protein
MEGKLLPLASMEGSKMLQSTTSPSLLDEYYTETELAAHLGKTARTLFEWRKRGVGPPPTPVGRNFYYRKTAARQWLMNQER